jgi:seryl-tRNA synthetase
MVTEPTQEGPPDPPADFRSRLLEAGILVDGGSPGLYLRSGQFERVVSGIHRMVSAAGAHHRAPVLHFPAVMARAHLERTGYLASFPDLVGSIHTFRGRERDHRDLMNALEDGEDWTSWLQPSDLAMCSAACHPLYPTKTGRLSPGGEVYEVFGQVFRCEPSLDPARMQTFRQHEFVYLGSADGAIAHRDRWVDQALALHRSLGLACEAVVANDPFFGRAGLMLAANQRAEALKVEIVCPITSEVRLTAITSANCHRDHFGTEFGIETDTGDPAHSACVGFGVERIALALYQGHGLDLTGWPGEVLGLLGLGERD